MLQNDNTSQYLISLNSAISFQISRDAAIFEIKRELPYEGAKFSSRYEIYNSTTKPFGKSYRELTVSSSASGVSSCDSHTSSLSSSGLSETTTYITCSSEIEPVQMTGFQCIDESTGRHSVCILNEENYDDIHEATNYNIQRLRPPSCKTESDDNDSEKEIVADKKSFSSFYATHSPAASAGDTESLDRVSPSLHKHIVNIETWSNGPKEEPLKSPILLKQMISNFEDKELHYKIPKSSTKTTYEEEEYTYEPELNTSSSKTVTRCRSLLNLELQPDVCNTEEPRQISKATSELNLQDEAGHKQQEKERITKTISIMLENRRRQAALQNAVTNADRPTHNSLTNEKLVNENVVLVEPRNARTLDRGTCRVTGEILKNKTPPRVSGGTYTDCQRNVCTLPRAVKSHRTQLQRHFYYPLHVVKSSARVPDEELPDPDKVKHARELFERVLKIGSLENVNNAGPGGAGRPKSPKKVENWSRPTPEVRQPHHTPVIHSKLHKCYSVDASQINQSYNHNQSPTFKWTDNGSMSSGVGSDISVETDIELSQRDGAGSGSGSCSDGKEEVSIFTSDEDLSSSHDADEPGKPITPDILNNIRAYGTSVTYYGGKIIASSKGYTCSPMTMTIMNEIRQSSPDYHANRKFLFDDKHLAKFRLIKSNSCGSRLELSGTEEYGRDYERKLNGLKEDCNNNELVRRETDTIAEEEEEEPGKRTENREHRENQESRLTTRESIDLYQGKQAAREAKQWTKNGPKQQQRPVNGKTYCDMEFEEFEVLEEKS